jgi:hypothetical protein
LFGSRELSPRLPYARQTYSFELSKVLLFTAIKLRFRANQKNARGRAGLDFLSKRGLSAGLRESPRVARVRTGRSAFNFANDGDQVFGDGLIYGCRKPNAQAFTDCVRNQIACRTRRVSRWHDPHGIVLMPVPSSSRTVVLAYRQPPSGAMVALSVRLFRLEFNFTQGTGVPATASPKRVVQKRSPHPDGAKDGASQVWHLSSNEDHTRSGHGRDGVRLSSGRL